MASVRGTRGVFGDGASTVRPRSAVFEDIEPSHAWTEDSNGHYLLVDLPDFKKEQVKIQVNSSGHIKINGERPVNETKRIRFEQTFKAPEKSNTDAITAKFDGEAQILYITVPKHKAEEIKREEPKPKPEPEPKPTIGLKDQQNATSAMPEISAHQKPDGDEAKVKDDIAEGCDTKETEQGGQRNACTSSFSQENVRGWEREPSHYLRSAMEMLSKNKGIVVTAMVAFSLGIFVSRKFESDVVGE